jgi:endoglucanase
MTGRERRRSRRTVRERLRRLLAALLALTCGLVPSTTAAGNDPPELRAGEGLLGDVLDVVRAVGSSRRFLDRYVDDDGRVVRRDQDGDTVSEGQAYALTVAAAIVDEETFRSVWEWTRRELRRDDGLFAWHWADGAVVDDDPAADADLLIAGALSIAAQRFDDPQLAVEARSTSDAVLAHETALIGGQHVLTAGPWAVDAGVFNPSYAVVPMMSLLWEHGERGWESVAASARLAIDRLTRRAPHLPPDWATVATDPSGGFRADALGRPPRYGWDAVRVPVQLAADCEPLGRRIAARMWPFFLSQDVAVAAVYELDGTVVDRSTHAAAIVGAAGAASAAGARGSATVLLDRATAWDVEHPTYYGSAWVALGRLWLTTALLGGCARR